MELKQFKLVVKVVNPTDQTDEHEYKYDVRYSTDPSNYGNGTYLSIGEDKYYDIRYDQEYHQGHEIEYLTTWACNYWSGENGSYKLTEISVKTV